MKKIVRRFNCFYENRFLNQLDIEADTEAEFSQGLRRELAWMGWDYNDNDYSLNLEYEMIDGMYTDTDDYILLAS